MRKRKLTFVLEPAAGARGALLAGGADGGAEDDRPADAAASPHCAAVNAMACAAPPGSQGGGKGGRGGAHAGERLFTASRDATIKRWALPAGGSSDRRGAGASGPRLEATFEGHVDWVNGVAVSGNTLISCSNDRTVRLWRAFDGSTGAGPGPGSASSPLLATLADHSDYVMSVCAAAEAPRFASAGLRGEVMLWDLATGKTTASASPTPLDCACADPAASSYAVGLSGLGTILAAGATDGAVRVWDARALPGAMNGKASPSGSPGSPSQPPPTPGPGRRWCCEATRRGATSGAWRSMPRGRWR